MNNVVGITALSLAVGSLLTIALAESEERDSCDGFWSSLKCFLFGNPENRTGKGDGLKVDKI